ncbi:MAG: electron transfer flavoprotein subunit alpha/FixB family protein [Eubacteriaceae bacterium]|nr:electron transfer flavoprotein subunit alpha/FixB family protein [Eubacteriaceae bacterium]
MNINDYSGIWVFSEQIDGQLSKVSFELLGKAVELKKETNEEITSVLLGSNVSSLAQILINFGSDKVIIVDSPNLKEYKTISYSKVLYELAVKYKPSIFLIGATSIGKDLAPRVMAKLQTGLTADCLDLSIDQDGNLVQTKPSYGGNIMCKIIMPNHRPQMTTLRPKVFNPIEERKKAEGIIIKEDILVEEEKDYVILETIQQQTGGLTIEEAEIIVSAGRGIGDKENIRLLQELADAMGGKLGASRPLVDNGWIEPYDQIGQSGKTVKPKLIINVAISGSVQYMVGMQNSGYIVSINRNPDAEIITISQCAIVGDFKDIVPAITQEIKNRK